ncbi:MAG: hypothetical protein U1C73_15095, partial [Dietzia sp.]|nr:hypothetical protein [Dietzia sp.]
MTTHSTAPEPADPPTDDNADVVSILDKPPRRCSTDHDAASGAKTRKDGKTEFFYGYEEHTLVQTAPRRSPKPIPPLVRRFELTPAATDIVDVTLSLLDRLPEPVTDISVDRHYHYKEDSRWRHPLAERGINQVHDLRTDEHGFTEIDHTRWAAGWPHCPSTPDTLAVIPRPAPGSDTDDRTHWSEFKRRIAERQAYAFRRVASARPDGTARWECPAVAGTVGCPHRQGTISAAIELGLPIVENPPDLDGPDTPTCCTQRSVTIHPAGVQRKLMQHDYWGSPEWEREYNKRTYVEGSYGARKNSSSENISRGFIRTGGLPLYNLMSAMAAASYNLRMLRNAHDRSDLPDTID